MEYIFIIIRFPFFVVIILAITALALPVAIAGWVVTPFLQLTIWLAYLLSAPVVLVWNALLHDKKAMASHWGVVEQGPNLFAHYESIGSWLSRKYETAYDWMVGD